MKFNNKIGLLLELETQNIEDIKDYIFNVSDHYLNNIQVKTDGAIETQIASLKEVDYEILLNTYNSIFGPEVEIEIYDVEDEQDDYYEDDAS